MTQTHQPIQRREHNDADWYDFPAWYDILHARGTAHEVRGLEAIARRFADTPVYRRSARSDARPRWIEPACGSGRYLRAAASRGIRTTGIDTNPHMIAYARASFTRRGLDGRFIVGDMTSTTVSPPADFAFCTINTIRHLPTDQALLAHFEAVAASLKPGGVYAVGIGLTDYESEFPSEDTWTGARGRCRVTQVIQYLPATRERRVECAINHLAVVTPRTERHVDSVYELRAYNLRQWMSIIRRCPLELAGVCDEHANLLEQGPSHAVNGYAIFALRTPPH